MRAAPVEARCGVRRPRTGAIGSHDFTDMRGAELRTYQSTSCCQPKGQECHPKGSEATAETSSAPGPADVSMDASENALTYNLFLLCNYESFMKPFPN